MEETFDINYYINELSLAAYPFEDMDELSRLSTWLLSIYKKPSILEDNIDTLVWLIAECESAIEQLGYSRFILDELEYFILYLFDKDTYNKIIFKLRV